MTNRLSILGKVNGGRWGVYGDSEKSGESPLNLRFTIHDLRVGGCDRATWVDEYAAADTAYTAALRGSGRLNVGCCVLRGARAERRSKQFLRLIALNCAFLQLCLERKVLG